MRTLEPRVDTQLFKFPTGEIISPKPGLAEERTFNGPVSAKMWETISKLDSSYEDDFDWSIYDKLHARFGENQPRGGVVFKTALKMVNYHPQCSKCHYSLEIDTYGRGCIHNCVYCYAKDQLTLRGYWNRPHPMPIDLSEIRKIFFTVFETAKQSKWRTILSKRVPIRIGSMSDSFMWMDQKYGVTKEFLKILKFYRYPYIVFTRSDLVAEDSYLQVLDKQLASIQFSISGQDEAITKTIEPGAPSVKRRLKALRKLADAGFWTTVRINPLFPKYPDGYFTDRENLRNRFADDSIPQMNLLDIDQPSEFMSSLKEARVPSVIAGFVRLNQTSVSQLSKATGIDLRKFFKPEFYRSSGESHFSNEEIRHYYTTLHKSALDHQIRFSTCYIGNGIKDYYQYQSLWTSKKDCCDALGNVRGIATTSQVIPWEERHRHSPDTKISKSAEEQETKLDSLFETTDSGSIAKIDGVNVSRIKWTKQNESQSPV